MTGVRLLACSFDSEHSTAERMMHLDQGGRDGEPALWADVYFLLHHFNLARTGELVSVRRQILEMRAAASLHAHASAHHGARAELAASRCCSKTAYLGCPAAWSLWARSGLRSLWSGL